MELMKQLVPHLLLLQLFVFTHRALVVIVEGVFKGLVHRAFKFLALGNGNLTASTLRLSTDSKVCLESPILIFRIEILILDVCY